MKQPYLVLTPRDVAEYIQTQVNVLDHNTQIPNKILECAAALILARFHLKRTGEHSNFVFPLKTGTTSVQVLAELIQKYINEDTPIDIQLINAAIPLDKNPAGKVRATAFQLKRFSLGSSDKTEELIKFLTEEMPRHYAPLHATLVILLEGVGAIHIKEINRALHSLKKYPFHSVLFLCGEGDYKTTIGEMWPQNGQSTFTKEEWFTDLLDGESAN